MRYVGFFEVPICAHLLDPFWQQDISWSSLLSKETVSNIIKGSFSVAGSNHGKHIYKKDRPTSPRKVPQACSLVTSDYSGCCRFVIFGKFADFAPHLSPELDRFCTHILLQTLVPTSFQDTSDPNVAASATGGRNVGSIENNDVENIVMKAQEELFRS